MQTVDPFACCGTPLVLLLLAPLLVYINRTRPSTPLHLPRVLLMMPQRQLVHHLAVWKTCARHGR
jgi:hypothetical protein